MPFTNVRRRGTGSPKPGWAARHYTTHTMSHTIVIFGASGDLTSRKLVPALYSLRQAGELPAETRIVGFSRTPMTDDAWRATLRDTTAKHADAFDEQAWLEFAGAIHYQPGDIGKADDFAALKQRLETLEGGRETTRVYYLATAPQFYVPVVARLGERGMADETHGPRRIVVEKPFGTDLASARLVVQHKGVSLQRVDGDNIRLS